MTPKKAPAQKRTAAKKASAGEVSTKQAPDLDTFIERVNKKDKRNGLKIHFAFVKRKRK